MSYGQQLVEIQREDLYAEIWADPFVKVAPRYGLSDVGIKKICKKLNIPVPGRGYWAKLAQGKNPRKLALPKLKSGEQERVFIKKRPPQVPSSESTGNQATTYWSGPKIEIPETGELSHPITLRIKKENMTAKVDEDGRLRSRFKDAFPFWVSPENFDRALQIIDTLLHALDGTGNKVELTEFGFQWETRFGSVEFKLYESLIGIERRPNNSEREQYRYQLTYPVDHPYRPKFYRWVKSGNLFLAIETDEKLGVRKAWSDTEKTRLEKALTSFASGLTRFAEAKKASDEAAERRRLEWAERERQWQKEREERRIEERRQKELDIDLADWLRAKRIRDFAAAMEAAALAEFGTDLSEEIKARLSWTRCHADSLDPTIELDFEEWVETPNEYSRD